MNTTENETWRSAQQYVYWSTDEIMTPAKKTCERIVNNTIQQLFCKYNTWLGFLDSQNTFIVSAAAQPVLRTLSCGYCYLPLGAPDGMPASQSTQARWRSVCFAFSLRQFYPSQFIIYSFLKVGWQKRKLSPERSEGSLRRLRDSSVAANTLPQSDIIWTLRKPWFIIQEQFPLALFTVILYRNERDTAFR